jgi:hypothetical protein
MSRKVRLPMTCTPARAMLWTLQQTASSSFVNNQSISPAGPLTKPSNAMDIFRITSRTRERLPHSPWNFGDGGPGVMVTQ